MRIKYNILSFFICFFFINISAQHENDNWLFGNKMWTFDSNFNNGFQYVNNIFPHTNQGNATISDKNTGELLFHTNGATVFNKNGIIMENGNYLFGPNTSVEMTNFYYQLSDFEKGNPSSQGVVILPRPSHNSRYFVFSLNGDMLHSGSNTPNLKTKIGLQYAEIEMNENSGLGKVISKNNVVFSNTKTNSMTTTVSSDGTFYWLITQDDNGNFLSYKITSQGFNTTPVISSNNKMANYGIKISPNGQRLFDIQNRELFQFNSTTGAVTNALNIIYQTTAYYPGSINGAEFSPNSNIIYFISKYCFLCCGCKSGLAMYNISTNQIQGYNNSLGFPFFTNLNGSLQLSKNGKIYISGKYIIDDAHSGNNNYYYINDPNTWPYIDPYSSNSSPDIITKITNNSNGVSAGINFPQLIPSLNSCPDNLNIDYPISQSQNFQAGQSITASSIIDDDLNVNYKAGDNVNLLTGFHVKSSQNSLFHAYIGPCEAVFKMTNNSSITTNNIFKQTKTLFMDIKISPNPASTFINIDSGNEILSSWEMYELSGKIVLKGNSKYINIESLPKAYYLLKININNKTITKKVIVK